MKKSGNNRYSRRTVVKSLVGGTMLLPGILHQLIASEDTDPLAPKSPHHPAKANRVIFLFMTGGVSHIDTFDPKPSTNGRDGNGPDKLMGCIWPYSADPVTGIEVSDLFPHLRNRMKDICLIRSMHSAHFDHTEATLGMHTCSATFARPSWGSWLSYGLGSYNDELPSFVVLAPSLPYGGTQVYANDFLPASHQGTRIVPGKEPISDLTPYTGLDLQRKEMDFTSSLNRNYQKLRSDDSNLSARIRSFETAFKMQMAAPEAFDIDAEPDYILEDYGLERGQNEGYGWQCLMARRLAERGVRFIEVIHKGSALQDNWDQHADMKNYEKLALEADRPIAALLKDLKVRGMLEDTLVVFATEFGRTPTRDNGFGRHHHGGCFSMWVAGGGYKAGHVHGATDERGFSTVESPVDIYDFYATLLHQLGIDHERLTYRHAGRDFRLTDVHGNVRTELI